VPTEEKRRTRWKCIKAHATELRTEGIGPWGQWERHGSSCGRRGKKTVYKLKEKKVGTTKKKGAKRPGGGKMTSTNRTAPGGSWKNGTGERKHFCLYLEEGGIGDGKKSREATSQKKRTDIKNKRKSGAISGGKNKKRAE